MRSVEVLAKLLRAAARKTSAQKTTSLKDRSLLASAQHETVCRSILYNFFFYGCIGELMCYACRPQKFTSTRRSEKLLEHYIK
jgi:hypothetical protein